eukprot:Ihof_evm14s3 gene=Ihof_evmTU14s3
MDYMEFDDDDVLQPESATAPSKPRKMRYGNQPDPQQEQYPQSQSHPSGMLKTLFGTAIEREVEGKEDLELPGEGFNRYFINMICQAELKHLKTCCPKGIYVIPSAENSKVWNGVSFVSEGLFAGGVFKFNIKLPNDFPKRRPEVEFKTYIAHPQVSIETGSIGQYLLREIPEWDPNQHHVSDILLIIANMFLLIDTSMPINKAAAELYENSPKKYEQLAAQCVQQSLHERMENQPGTGMKFSPYNSLLYDPMFQNMLEK